MFLAQQGGQLGDQLLTSQKLSCSVALGSTMQHDERRCSADVVLGDRTNSSTDAEGGISVIDVVRDQIDRG